MLLGVVITSLLALGLYMTMRAIFKIGGTQLSGMLAGAQTQPAVLATLNTRTGADPHAWRGMPGVSGSDDWQDPRGNGSRLLAVRVDRAQ